MYRNDFKHIWMNINIFAKILKILIFNVGRGECFAPSRLSFRGWLQVFDVISDDIYVVSLNGAKHSPLCLQGGQMEFAESDGLVVFDHVFLILMMY